MSVLILVGPCLSFIVNSCLGHLVGRVGGWLVSILLLFISDVVACYIFYNIAFSDVNYIVDLFLWVHLGYLTINWGLLFDPLAITMSVVVLSISLIVHIYSLEYMKNDPFLQKFLAYLSLFTFFMLVLVSSDNFLQLFVGWEGVGLCSFLLINFWYTRIAAIKSAIKAFILNRIGDLGLLIGLFLLQHYTGSLNFQVVFLVLPELYNLKIDFVSFNFYLVDVIGFCLLVGAVGKSAQIGLHSWLPDAMEGPTPVSALLHSATMVTAGVFLLLRASPIIDLSANVLNFTAIIGAITCLFTGFLGVFQYDIKKIIAYSTCSQLGYMIFACGLSLYPLSMYHLFNHAFFKALLFLGAGSVIHGVSGEQDIRKMGGLLYFFPVTFSFMLVGSLSLMGFPFLSGFYSKDFIIEFALGGFLFSNSFCYILSNVAAFLTALYSIRLLIYVFLVKPNGFRHYYAGAHEPSLLSNIPLTFLVLCSIFTGFFFKDMMVGFGTSFWKDSFSVLASNSYYYRDLDFESFLISCRYFTLVLGISGFYLAYHIYNSNESFNFFYDFILRRPLKYIKYYWTQHISIITFFHSLGFFDKIYNNTIVNCCFNLGLTFYKLLDKGLCEILGPFGISSFLSDKYKLKNYILPNNIHQQALLMFFGVLLFNLFIYFFIG